MNNRHVGLPLLAIPGPDILQSLPAFYSSENRFQEFTGGLVVLAQFLRDLFENLCGTLWDLEDIIVVGFSRYDMDQLTFNQEPDVIRK